MARTYSRRKGKSGSTRPEREKQPTWIRYKSKEIEMIIVKLAKSGNTTAKIGMILRDSYGIPDVRQILNKKITAVLKDNKISKEIPEDLMNLIKRSIQIKNHFKKNHKDMTAKRGLQLTESKIMRLIKYYKSSGKLERDWKYDPEKIKLLID